MSTYAELLPHLHAADDGLTLARRIAEHPGAAEFIVPASRFDAFLAAVPTITAAVDSLTEAHRGVLAALIQHPGERALTQLMNNVAAADSCGWPRRLRDAELSALVEPLHELLLVVQVHDQLEVPDEVAEYVLTCHPQEARHGRATALQLPGEPGRSAAESVAITATVLAAHVLGGGHVGEYDVNCYNPSFSQAFGPLADNAPGGDPTALAKDPAALIAAVAAHHFWPALRDVTHHTPAQLLTQGRVLQSVDDICAVVGLTTADGLTALGAAALAEACPDRKSLEEFLVHRYRAILNVVPLTIMMGPALSGSAPDPLLIQVTGLPPADHCGALGRIAAVSFAGELVWRVRPLAAHQAATHDPRPLQALLASAHGDTSVVRSLIPDTPVDSRYGSLGQLVAITLPASLPASLAAQDPALANFHPVVLTDTMLGLHGSPDLVHRVLRRQGITLRRITEETQTARGTQAPVLRQRFAEAVERYSCTLPADEQALLVAELEAFAATGIGAPGVWVDYLTSDAAPSRRLLTQLTLTDNGLVHAYCHRRQEARVFRLDRITAVYAASGA